MRYLILFVVTAVASAHLIRYGQRRGCRMAWVGAVTYMTATVCTALWVTGVQRPMWSPVVPLGASAGVALGVTYLFFNSTIQQQGVGVAHFVRQLALAIPILASVVIWHESVSSVRGVGLALVFVALPLMVRSLDVERGAWHGWRLMFPLGLLVCAGLTNTLFKAYAARNVAGGQPHYLLFLFGGAGIAVTFYALRTGQWPDRRDIVHGVILGLDNVLLNYFRIRALETELGILAFPTMSIGVILLSAAVAAVIWKERYRGRVLVGMGIALLALILINASNGG